MHYPPDDRHWGFKLQLLILTFSLAPLRDLRKCIPLPLYNNLIDFQYSQFGFLEFQLVSTICSYIIRSDISWSMHTFTWFVKNWIVSTFYCDLYFTYSNAGLVFFWFQAIQSFWCDNTSFFQYVNLRRSVQTA